MPPRWEAITINPARAGPSLILLHSSALNSAFVVIRPPWSRSRPPRVRPGRTVVGDQLVGADPVRMIVNHRRDHQLVGPRALREGVELRPHGLRPADHRRAREHADALLLGRGELMRRGLLRGRKAGRAPGAQARHRQARGPGEVAGALVVLGRDRRHGDHRVRLGELLGRPEVLAIELQGRVGVARHEVVGEREVHARASRRAAPSTRRIRAARSPAGRRRRGRR